MATQAYSKGQLAGLLQVLDLGSSVAEHDDLLESARVETSTFTDLLHDRVDLIPGTKGSGKTALYRIFVEFLADYLLEQRKVVIAHGVHHHGDVTFQVFREQFSAFSEDEFVNFWCIYLVSLASEEFIKSGKYDEYLETCQSELEAFHQACRQARIPPLAKKQTLRDVIASVLHALQSLRPAVRVSPDDGSALFTLTADRPSASIASGGPSNSALPQFVTEIAGRLEELLECSDMSLWLMVDRLDEIFPRRSPMETAALRGLLRTLRIFESSRIRVKVFLRDDILTQVTVDQRGFAALTHVTARQADRLKWSEEQILTMIMNRLAACKELRAFLEIDTQRLAFSREYREEVFYQVFPATVHRGSRQSPTLRWIYNHVSDGLGVVTPRDVIDLLARAKQRQQDEFRDNPEGEVPYVIGSAAIQYGLRELSRRKCETYLQAEFAHFWKSIEKLIEGKTEYSPMALKNLWGTSWERIRDDLIAIGLLKVRMRGGHPSYQIPHLYRAGLKLTQGSAE